MRSLITRIASVFDDNVDEEEEEITIPVVTVRLSYEAAAAAALRLPFSSEGSGKGFRARADGVWVGAERLRLDRYVHLRARASVPAESVGCVGRRTREDRGAPIARRGEGRAESGSVHQRNRRLAGQLKPGLHAQLSFHVRKHG